jgi:hypothetical protein
MWISTALSPYPGKFYVIAPDLASLTSYSAEDIALPSTLSGVDRTCDFNTWVRGVFTRTYILGGHTDNMVFTEQKWLLRLGINPPSGPLVNAAPVVNEVGFVVAAAPGLTGQVSFALRFRDTLHNRRSPLGAGSPIITMVNQGATFSNVPTGPVPADPCYDIIEIWASVDGDFFRHLADRDAGATTFVVNETLTGEAYLEELAPWPKLAFGALANDQLFAAGDPRHPERVYYSVVGFPEEYGGGYLTTRNGETVIGLKAVGSSTIYVQCANSCYYIQGFGSGDLIMRSLKTHIGGFGQEMIAMADDVAIIPTQRGVFRFDGTSMVLIGEGDWDDTWRRDVVAQPDNYQKGFARVDYVRAVVKIHNKNSFLHSPVIGMPITRLGSLYWIVNMGGLIPEVGGGGQADLSFDQRGYGDGSQVYDTTAAMLFPQNGKIGNFYTADSLGNILLENVARGLDYEGYVQGSGPIVAIIHTPHIRVTEAPDYEDAWQFLETWLNFQCEYMDVSVEIFSGNDFSWQSITPEQFTVLAGRLARYIVVDPPLDPEPSVVPRDKYMLHPVASAGSCISLRVTVNQTTVLPPGGVYGVDQEQRAVFVFSGWGFVATDGSEQRPPGVYNPGA